jgi:hypothetical protein
MIHGSSKSFLGSLAENGSRESGGEGVLADPERKR